MPNVQTTLISLAALTVLVLTGCGLPAEAPHNVAPDKNRVQVERTLYRHVVEFSGAATTPDASEREALRDFLRRSGADRDATVVVSAADSQGADLAETRRLAVERLLREVGFRPKPHDPLLDPHPSPSADVLVRIARYHAVLPECPDHTRTKTSDFYNLPSSNFGCATERNLGAMVAEPRDLLRGRDLAPADAERHTRPVRAYRQGKSAGGKGGGGSGGGGGGVSKGE